MIDSHFYVKELQSSNSFIGSFQKHADYLLKTDTQWEKHESKNRGYLWVSEWERYTTMMSLRLSLTKPVFFDARLIMDGNISSLWNSVFIHSMLRIFSCVPVFKQHEDGDYSLVRGCLCIILMPKSWWFLMSNGVFPSAALCEWNTVSQAGGRPVLLPLDQGFETTLWLTAAQLQWPLTPHPLPTITAWNQKSTV